MDRVRSQRVGILDRGIARQRSEVSVSSAHALLTCAFDMRLCQYAHSAYTPQVSASAFAFLFSEMVQYSQNRVTSIPDLERKYALLLHLQRHTKSLSSLWKGSRKWDMALAYVC
jgi:hypothetical protein